MSRGYGKIQRAILEMFEKNRNRTVESFMIAAYIFESNPVNASQRNSTNRALRKLVEAGEIEDLGHNEYGRKMYGLPGRKKRHLTRVEISQLTGYAESYLSSKLSDAGVEAVGRDIFGKNLYDKDEVIEKVGFK